LPEIRARVLHHTKTVDSFFYWVCLISQKNIFTSLELSFSKNSKLNLMRSKVPINMQLVHEIWLKCDGVSGQLQSTKLTSRHFVKNAYSCMNVRLATQLLSQSTVEKFDMPYLTRVLCSAYATKSCTITSRIFVRIGMPLVGAEGSGGLSLARV
jgi:hypothetical protein